MKNSEVYGVYLKFNPKTEKELIEKLERVKKKNTYIKDLIRDDIKLELLIKKRSLLKEDNDDRNKLDGGNYSNDNLFNINHYLE